VKGIWQVLNQLITSSMKGLKKCISCEFGKTMNKVTTCVTLIVISGCFSLGIACPESSYRVDTSSKSIKYIC